MSENFDNIEFNIIGKDQEKLELSLKVALYKKTVTHYKVDTQLGLQLCNSDGDGDENTIELPFKITSNNAYSFVSEWLNQLEDPSIYCTNEESYGDDDNVIGWRIYVPLDDNSHIICAIVPHNLWLCK